MRMRIGRIFHELRILSLTAVYGRTAVFDLDFLLLNLEFLDEI